MKKWMIGLVALVVVAVAGYLVFGRGLISATASEATPAADAGEIPPVEAGSGVVADAVVVPVQSARLSLSAGGVVAELLVAEGDPVRTGQVMLRLDAARQAAAVAQAEAQVLRAQSALAALEAGPRPEEIQVARTAVEVAQAQLARLQQGARAEEIAAAEAALAAAEASLQKVKEGPRAAELIAARADLANAEATLRQAQAAYDRVKGEPGVGALPQSLQLEQATNMYTAAKARLAALQQGAGAADLAAARAQVQQAQAQLDAVRTSARPADLAAAEAEIRRAEAQLALLEAGARPEAIAAAEADVAAAEAVLEQARVALAETELRAPFAGTVASLEAKIGEQVAPGVPIVVLADLSAWQIETDDLTEINVVRVHDGDPATITFDALPDLNLSGTVVRVEAIGQTNMGDITYAVIIAPDQQDSRLRWNMTAAVVIEPK
jgi:multidrug resistance efflux pump